ncbi:DUF1660 family phage protein [Methanolobus vulcani]|uniref:Uncharacterized protein n=1 Tax=Methanolobus vulcani TaxID=38026 RepID=A0A7Z8KM00_9EURY|nr:DUF1660 family phage protein [Methanolobus vulcani]TQD23903.1 hypothetical protein FKV42_11885 [Methanolobus vulcani]
MVVISILCKLGLHKWRKAGSFSNFSSNVRDQRYECARCGKRKTKVEAK